MKIRKRLYGVLSVSLLCSNLITPVAQAVVYNVNPSLEDSSCEILVDTETTSTTSTQDKTSSKGASETDWTKEGTVAYKHAKQTFDTFTNAGLSGEAAAGIIGWVNSEGGWYIVDRAEGHYGNDPTSASISKGVVPIPSGAGYSVGGGGVYQFTPYTKFAPLGDSKWDSMEEQTKFVLSSIKNGDWIASMDMSGKNQTFEQFAKNTNIEETALGWQAYERGNVALIPRDKKIADAKKANEVFNKDKVKFDEKKFKAFFGGSSDSNSDSSKSSSSSNKQKQSDLPSVSASDWELVLVNRGNKKDEMNPKLAKVGNIEVDERIKQNVEDFLAKAKTIDSKFHLISGYRSVETQKKLYDSYLQKEKSSGLSDEEAEKKVQTYSQPAGASEHQTGLAIDISTVDSLNEMSKETADKLKKIAEEFGFVRRFEESKSSSTGVGFEDWHYRYVGKDSAKYMNKHNLSLEEYLEKLREGANETSGDDCAVEESSDSSSVNHGGSGEWAKDKTGSVSYRQYSAWKPNDLPDDLKPYAINPESVGMKLNDTSTWKVRAYSYGQCTDLSASLMYALWEKDGGHPRQAQGNGAQAAGNWASALGGSTSKEPSAGAVFSGGGTPPYGHTGVVSHVFENGDILICEQNFTGYSGDNSGLPATWDYRYVPKAQQTAEGWTFYSPSKAGYKIVDSAKSH